MKWTQNKDIIAVDISKSFTPNFIFACSNLKKQKGNLSQYIVFNKEHLLFPNRVTIEYYPMVQAVSDMCYNTHTAYNNTL